VCDVEVYAVQSRPSQLLSIGVSKALQSRVLAEGDMAVRDTSRSGRLWGSVGADDDLSRIANNTLMSIAGGEAVSRRSNSWNKSTTSATNAPYESGVAIFAAAASRSPGTIELRNRV